MAAAPGRAPPLSLQPTLPAFVRGAISASACFSAAPAAGQAPG
jgi:hypothetical protein